jgi:hypothetical protein
VTPQADSPRQQPHLGAKPTPPKAGNKIAENFCIEVAASKARQASCALYYKNEVVFSVQSLAWQGREMPQRTRRLFSLPLHPSL